MASDSFGFLTAMREEVLSCPRYRRRGEAGLIGWQPCGQLRSLSSCAPISCVLGTGMSAEAEAVLGQVEAAADRMSTSVRFVRRLIAERRIGFVKLDRPLNPGVQPSAGMRALSRRKASPAATARIRATRMGTFPVGALCQTSSLR